MIVHGGFSSLVDDSSVTLKISVLTCEDILAGLFLIVFALFGICLYLVVCSTMLTMCQEIVGFRFLLSQALSDLLLIFQFGIWPGAVILARSELIPSSLRWHLHFYLDFTWWAMVYHYPIVAWSRLAAVQWPNWFRCLPNSTCILICSSAWVLGLIQSIVEHQFEWFEPLHYSAEQYGLTADWVNYNMNGTATYYMIFNVSSMILPFPFYGLALCVLFRRQKRQMIDPRNRQRGASLTPSSILLQRQLSIETRLLIPCIINTVLFVVGQVLIALCSRYSGKWINLAVLLIFACNSIVNPLLYLCFSSVIRRQLFVNCQRRLSSSALYRDYEFRSSSPTPSSLAQQRSSLIRWKKDSCISSS